MYQGHKVGLILLMAGSGERCFKTLPKQFALLQGTPVYVHTLRKFLQLNIFDQIVLVSHPDYRKKVSQEHPDCIVVEGKKSRQGSCFAGLLGFSDPPDIVMVHDAVRPFVSEAIILQNLEKAAVHGAVDTCVASTDTVVHAPTGEEILSIPLRKEYLRGQTPQTFRFSCLYDAHSLAFEEGLSDVSDDCQLVLRQGHPIHIVAGCERNFKITTELDYSIANIIINL